MRWMLDVTNELSRQQALAHTLQIAMDKNETLLIYRSPLDAWYWTTSPTSNRWMTLVTTIDPLDFRCK